ncbi:NADH:flavin oxidoreductase [Trichoderma afarasin]
MPSLLEPIRIGALNCPNRIIMSPMTRNRAPNAIPNKMMLDYYVRRASFGLIITEGIAVSPMAVGYPRVPGIWTMEQTKAWREITTSVHEAGGRIIAQLWHVGRLSHPYYLNGSKPIGPSAIAAPGDVINMMPTEPYPVPRALDTWEVPEIVEQFRKAAENAQSAGFDGVELHGANGYILDQFLTDSTNSRVDEYGGTIENRAKLLLGAVDAVASVWGADRVGIQLSPRPSPGWHGDSNPIGIFSYLMRELSTRQIAFVIVRESPNKQLYIGAHLRSIFSGTYISNEEFTPETAKRAVLQGDIDAVAFGQLALANPDLPKRIADEAPLNQGDISTYWSAGSKGYDDYPTLDILYTTTST